MDYDIEDVPKYIIVGLICSAIIGAVESHFAHVNVFTLWGYARYGARMAASPFIFGFLISYFYCKITALHDSLK